MLYNLVATDFITEVITEGTADIINYIQSVISSVVLMVVDLIH